MGLETADSGEFSDFSGLRQSAVFQEDRLCENLSALSNIKLASPQLQNQIIEEALQRRAERICPLPYFRIFRRNEKKSGNFAHCLLTMISYF